MSVRPVPPVRAPSDSPARLERIQREHELHRALQAARTLQERLELLGDRDYLVRIVREMRDGLAADLVELAEPMGNTLDYIDDTPNISTEEDAPTFERILEDRRR